jgi:hypothetical protein
MGKTRKRLNGIEQDGKFFNSEERAVLQLEKYESPYFRGLSILVVLMGTAAFGVLLVVYTIWHPVSGLD